MIVAICMVIGCSIWLVRSFLLCWSALGGDLGAARYGMLKTGIEGLLVGGMVTIPILGMALVVFIISFSSYRRGRLRKVVGEATRQI